MMEHLPFSDESERMGKEEWIKWFIANVLPPPYNEYGISKDEFRWVSGWNDLRVCILQRLQNNSEKKEVG